LSLFNFLIDAQSLINGLLKLNPEERLSIPEILAHPWLADDDEEDTADEYNYYIVRNNKVPDSAADSTPSINTLAIENLFFPSKQKVRLSFREYCYIANDFYTHHIGFFYSIINLQ
jgi:serine/threonine protein kinase